MLLIYRTQAGPTDNPIGSAFLVTTEAFICPTVGMPPVTLCVVTSVTSYAAPGMDKKLYITVIH